MNSHPGFKDQSQQGEAQLVLLHKEDLAYPTSAWSLDLEPEDIIAVSSFWGNYFLYMKTFSPEGARRLRFR